MSLSELETEQYSRHLLLPEIGEEGQNILKQKAVLIVGLGGLGAPISIYLAAAGIGRIGIADFDTVEISNLQRQILYRHKDIGKKKVEIAYNQLKSINPNIKIERYSEKIDEKNAKQIIEKYDIINDGTDNFESRYLLNKICNETGKTNVYASIGKFEGQLSVFVPQKTACYNCLYPVPANKNDIKEEDKGVLCVLPALIGSLQATETIKVLLNIGTPLYNKLLLYNALDMSFRKLKINRAVNCPVCGKQNLKSE